MRSIERKFRLFETKHPFHSTYQCFVESIYNMNYTRGSIAHWFNKLVDKEDYKMSERKGIVSDLLDKSKTAEDCTK